MYDDDDDIFVPDISIPMHAGKIPVLVLHSVYSARFSLFPL